MEEPATKRARTTPALPPLKRHYLTPSKTSWVDVGVLPRGFLPADMQAMLNEVKPATRGKVVMFGREMDVPRWQATFGHDYTFAGVAHKALPLPECLQEMIASFNATSYVTEGPPGFVFNEALVNWMDDGSEYIGAHSDALEDLHVVRGWETTIVGVSLGATRTLRLRPKKGMNGYPRDFELCDRTVYVMGGKTQYTHTHEIPKIGGKRIIGPRVSVTLRCFKEK
jgi:alkylated DNA repair dioxygenase AlkB